MKYLSVGLEGRDRVNQALGGGFPEGSVVLLEGGTGAGKSVLAGRFTYGMCGEGTTVGVASTGLTAAEYVHQMHSLSYDVSDHLLSERLRYFQVDLAQERPLLERLFSPSILWDGRAVVVDGFGELCRTDDEFGTTLGTGDEDRAMQRVVHHLEQATSGGTVVLLTVNPSTVTEQALRPLRGAADVYLQLQSEAVGQEIRKKALVRRFAGMKSPVDDTIGFSVQQGRGVVIESRTIA